MDFVPFTVLYVILCLKCMFTRMLSLLVFCLHYGCNAGRSTSAPSQTLLYVYYIILCHDFNVSIHAQSMQFTIKCNK